MPDEPLALTAEECDLILTIRREQLRRNQQESAPLTPHESEVNERAELQADLDTFHARLEAVIAGSITARAERDQARAERDALQAAGSDLAHWLQAWLNDHPGQTWCYSEAALDRWRALGAGAAGEGRGGSGG
jgi:uncharacterized protein YhdP